MSKKHDRRIEILEKQLHELGEDRDDLWRENERLKSQITELNNDLSRSEQRIRDNELEYQRMRSALEKAQNTLKSLGHGAE